MQGHIDLTVSRSGIQVLVRNKNPPSVQTLVSSRKLSSQNGPAQNLTYYERNEGIPPLFLANSEHYYKQIIGPNNELNKVRKKSKFQDVQNHHHKTEKTQLFRNKRNSYYKTFDSIEKLQYKFLNNSEQKNVNGETPLPTSDYDADDEDIDIKGGTLSEYEQKCMDHLCHTLEKNREFDLGENSQRINKTFIESLYLEFVSEERSKKANNSTSKEKFNKMLQEMCRNGKYNNTERQRQKRTSNTNLQLAVVIPLVSEENCTEAPKFKRCIKKLCKSSIYKNIHSFKSKKSHHVDIPVYSYESEYDEKAAIKQPSWIDPQNHTLRSPDNYSQLRESKIIEFPTQYPKAVSKEMRDNTYKERDKYFQNNIKSFPHENQNYKVPSEKDNNKFFYNEPRDYDTSISSLQSQFEAKTHELKKVLKDRREKLRNKTSTTQQKMLQKNLFLPFQHSSEDEILKYSPLKHHKFHQKMQNRNDETHKVHQKNFTKNIEKENFAVPLEIEQARSQTHSQHVIDYMWTNNGEQLTPVSSDMNTRAPSQKAGVIKYDRQNVNKHQSPRTDSSSQSETTQESFLPSFQPSTHAIKSTEYDNLSENFALKDDYSSKEQDQISPLTSDHMPDKYHPPKYQYVNQASNTENDRLPLSSTLNGINTYPESNNKPHNVLFPKKQLQKEEIQSNEKADILQQLNIKDIYRNLPPDFELSAGQWIHVQPSETIQRRREPGLNLMGTPERDINFKIPENEEDLRELKHLAKESEIRNHGRNKDPSDTIGYRAEYSNTNTSKTGSDTAPSFRQQSGHPADDNRISRLKNALKLTTQEILSSLDSPYITGHKYPGFNSQLEKPKNDFEKIENTPHSSEVSDKLFTQKIQHMHNGSKKSANIQTEDVNLMDILHFSTNDTDHTSPPLSSNLDYEERERTVANWTFRSLNSLYPPVTETYSLFPYLSADKSDLHENTTNGLSRDNKNQTSDYLDDSKENTQMSTKKENKEHKYQYVNDNHKNQLTIHNSDIQKETDKIEQIRTEETPQWRERNSRRNVTKFASDSKLLQQENDVASWNDSSHAVVDILTKILEKPEQERKSESTTLHSGITSTTKSEKESSSTTNKEISSDFRSSGSAERQGSNLLEKGAFSTTPDLTNEHLNQWKNQDITQTLKNYPSENIDSTLISNQPPTQDDPRTRNNSEIPKTDDVKTSNNLDKSMHNLMKIPTLESISHPEMRSKNVDFANDQSVPQSFSIGTAPNINFNTDEAEYSGTMLIVDPNTGAVTETIPVSGRLLTLNLQQEGNLPQVFLNTQYPENASPYNPHIQAGAEKYQATSQGELGYSLYPEVNNIISNSPSATLAGIPQSNQERHTLHEFETLKAVDQLAGGGDRKEMVKKERIQVPQNLNMQSNHDPFPGTKQNNPSKESLYERPVSSSFLTDHTDLSTDERSADSQNQETNDLTLSVYPEVDLSCHETDLACKKARDDVYGKFFSVMLKEMQTIGNDTCTESCINSKFIPACEQCIKKLLYEKESDDTMSEEVEKFAAKYCPPKNVIEKQETSTGEASSSSYNKCKYKFIADLTSLFSLWLRAVSNSR